MLVEVRVLSGVIPATGGRLEVDDGATGRDVLNAMGVESLESIIMILNGRRQDLATEIKDGDKIHFMTPLAGG